jgi:hypothetical protein
VTLVTSFLLLWGQTYISWNDLHTRENPQAGAEKFSQRERVSSGGGWLMSLLPVFTFSVAFSSSYSCPWALPRPFLLKPRVDNNPNAFSFSPEAW